MSAWDYLSEEDSTPGSEWRFEFPNGHAAVVLCVAGEAKEFYAVTHLRGDGPFRGTWVRHSPVTGTTGEAKVETAEGAARLVWAIMLLRREKLVGYARIPFPETTPRKGNQP